MRAGDGAGSTVSAASLTAHESALALHDVPKKVACDGEQIHLHGIDAQIGGAAHLHQSLGSQIFGECIVA